MRLLPLDVAVYVATGRVDLRWSFDALSGLARERMQQDPRGGALFVYINARRSRLKALFYDGTGYCLLHKRLDRGTFPIPVVVPPGAEHVEISTVELELMLRGLELPGRTRRSRSPTSAAPAMRPPTLH